MPNETGRYDCLLSYPETDPDAVCWDTDALRMLQAADRVYAAGDPPAIIRALTRQPLLTLAAAEDADRTGWTTWVMQERTPLRVDSSRLITCDVGTHTPSGYRPLRDVTIFSLRPQSAGLLHQHRFALLGAKVLHQPLLDFGPPPDPLSVEQALNVLDSYQWLVFTSVAGVDSFLELLSNSGRDLRSLRAIKLAAIGPATAAALRRSRLYPDVVPSEYRSEGLAAALLTHVSGLRVLLARSDQGRDVLPELLRKVCHVDEVTVYRQHEVTIWNAEVLSALCSVQVGYVLLTSSNIAALFIQGLTTEVRQRLRRHLKLVSISPVTSAALRNVGAQPDLEASVYTLDGMLDVIVRDRSADLAGGVPGQVKNDGAGEDAKDIERRAGAGERETGEEVEEK